MTAEAAKQRPLTARTGSSPQRPKRMPPRAGPRRSSSVETILTAALPRRSASPHKSAGHARLHRRLVKAGSAVKQHEKYRRSRGDGKFVHDEQKGAAQQGDDGVQRHHDVALVDAVGQHAAQQRKDDHRRKRKRAHAAKERRRACGAQEMERQGKAQYGVSKQGDDLTQQHDDEIALAQRVSGAFA